MTALFRWLAAPVGSKRSGPSRGAKPVIRVTVYPDGVHVQTHRSPEATAEALRMIADRIEAGSIDDRP